MSNYFNLSILLFLLSLPLSAQENNDRLSSKIVNWGLKVGLNAVSSNHYEVWQNDTEITDKSFTNKVGFTGGVFMRVNLNTFFIQPELAYSHKKEAFSFQMSGLVDNVVSNTNIKAVYYELSLPALIGYNITKEGPYMFNVFLGPDFRYNYRTRFERNTTEFYEEEDWYHINGVVGFSINVSHLFFDFRYVINRPNTNVNFNDIPNFPEYLKDIHIKKNENILSFSCGLLF